jgi:hypothetical protein
LIVTANDLSSSILFALIIEPIHLS